MKGRLENQIKTEKRIEKLLADMPSVVSDYYLNFSASKEFRSCLAYIHKLRKFIVWYADINDLTLKNVDCTQIDDKDIAKYMKLIETKQTNEGTTAYTSFSYRRQNWSVLNSFFDYMDKKELIHKNPMLLIDYPTKKDKVEHIFLSKNDLDKLIMAVTNGAGTDQMINYQKEWKERDLAIVYMFILTGMRESALCEINIEDLNFENNTLEVIDKEHEKHTYVIPTVLKELLEKWLIKRKELLNEEECDALFISNRRKRINQVSVQALIKKFAKEGLGYEVSPHRLRAAFCNIVFKETHDIRTTSKAMRHKNISTTEIYIENDEAKINKKVEEIFSNIF